MQLNQTSRRRLIQLSKQILDYRRFNDGDGHVMVQSNDTCGIVAVITKEDYAIPYLIEGIKILEPRGFDSAGITTINQQSNQLITTKYASEKGNDAIKTLEEVVKTGIHDGNVIGIGHTRWATHGARTDRNAHPHHDMADRIALCHNGVIENSAELKRDLIEKHNITFKSETDTEVISQLIGLQVAQGDNLFEATKKALRRLEGTWGLVIVDRLDPTNIVVAKNGSPLVIGIAKGKTFVASEPAAFIKYTKEFIYLQDNEIAILTADGPSLDRSRIEISHQEKIETSPFPHPHWTIKEILEQPESISRALNYGGRLVESGAKLGGLEENKEKLSTVNHLIISACGTSLFAGYYGMLLMKQLKSFETVQVIDSAELTASDFPSKNGGLLVISQSGETKDVHRALTLGLDLGVPCLSVVNVVGSLIARSTSCGVYLNAGREHAVASTKAFTSQVTVLSLVAIWFSNLKNTTIEYRKNLIDSLHRVPTNIGMTIHSIREKCRSIAELLLPKEHLFILGKGYSYPIALEGSLKIKEIGYIHAEGYSGGALKHGPFALIENGTPIICVALDDQHFQKMQIVIQEIKSRGAMIFIITNNRALYEEYRETSVLIPSNGFLTALLASIPFQLIAYEISILKGIDPDHPRNLAKSVTVD